MCVCVCVCLTWASCPHPILVGMEWGPERRGERWEREEERKMTDFFSSLG